MLELRSLFSVVPLATLMRRKTVEVQVEYLPEEKTKTPTPKNTIKFSRQVSLPANQIANRFFRQRMNSMPGDSAAGRKAGKGSSNLNKCFDEVIQMNSLTSSKIGQVNII